MMDVKTLNIWLPLTAGLLVGCGAGMALNWIWPVLTPVTLIFLTALASALAAGAAAIYMEMAGLGEIARLLTRIAVRQNVSEFLYHGYPGMLQAEIEGV